MTSDRPVEGAPEEQNLTRVCRRCSTQSTGSDAFCASCGTAFVKASRRPSRRHLVAGGLVLILVAGTVSGVLIKRSHDADVREDVATTAQQRADDQEQEAQRVQDEADELERQVRGELVTALEENITKDAKELVADGLLEGPVTEASCTATGNGSADDLTALTGTFECIAVNEKRDDGTLSGYSYAGTADWKSGELTWQLGG